jgi:hypothetical protein
VAVLCRRFADQSTAHADALAPQVERYGEEAPEDPSGCTTPSCSAD